MWRNNKVDISGIARKVPEEVADGIRQLDDLYEQGRDLEFDDLFEVVDIWMKTLYTNGRISHHEWMRFEKRFGE